MYPGQPLTHPSAHTDIARHCNNIMTLATTSIEHQTSKHVLLEFAVFLAGCVSMDTDVKFRAINLLGVMEGHGISRNAARARQLLNTVCEEQKQRIMAGRRPQEVDWISLAREKKLDMIDFGL